MDANKHQTDEPPAIPPKRRYSPPILLCLNRPSQDPDQCDTGSRASGDCANGDVPWDCASGNMD